MNETQMELIFDPLDSKKKHQEKIIEIVTKIEQTVPREYANSGTFVLAIDAVENNEKLFLVKDSFPRKPLSQLRV